MNNNKYKVKVQEMEQPYIAYETQNLPTKPVAFENLKITLHTNVDMDSDTAHRIVKAIIEGLADYGFIDEIDEFDLDIDIVESDTYYYEVETF